MTTYTTANEKHMLFNRKKFLGNIRESIYFHAALIHAAQLTNSWNRIVISIAPGGRRAAGGGRSFLMQLLPVFIIWFIFIRVCSKKSGAISLYSGINFIHWLKDTKGIATFPFFHSKDEKWLNLCSWWDLKKIEFALSFSAFSVSKYLGMERNKMRGVSVLVCWC